MTKIQTFFTAPITAFFKKEVYQDASQSSVKRGVLYNLYLAAIGAIVLGGLIVTQFVPQVNTFIDWTKSNWPTLVWTKQGVSLESGKTKDALVSPEYGPIAIFDMTKRTATVQDLGEAYVLITSQKLFYKRGATQIEEQDLIEPVFQTGQTPPERVLITGDVVAKLYQNLKGGIVAIIVVVGFLFAFGALLLGTLVYSLIALLIASIIKLDEKYGALFNITAFVGGITFVLTLVRLFAPFNAITWIPGINFVINVVVLFFVLKALKGKSETIAEKSNI